MDQVEIVRVALAEVGDLPADELAAFAQARFGVKLNPRIVPVLKAGNRRAKQTHIGEQNGPTWVQGYTSRNERPLLVACRCSCSVWA